MLTVSTIHHTDIDAEARREPLLALYERIAEDEGWHPRGEIRAHAAKSVYFALFTAGDIVGGVQVELGTAGSDWSFQSVWPESIPQRNAAYIAILALAKECRGQSDLFWLPCIEMWRYCRESGIADLWLAATPRTYSAYRRLGWPLEIKGQLRSHWSEDCLLTSMTVEGVAVSLREKARHSPKYRRIVEAMYRQRPDGLPIANAPRV